MGKKLLQPTWPMGKSPGKTSSNKIIKLRQARSDPRQAKCESCLPKEQPGKGHHHDDVILLLLPESFRALLSYANYSFRYINPTGIISKFKYERKNEVNSGPSSKKTSSCKWPINFFLALIISYCQTQKTVNG